MSDECGSVQRGDDPWKGLRIGAIFVILVTSLCGTLAPILAKRSWHVPTPAFDFVKYFGSGVIVRILFLAFTGRKRPLANTRHTHPFPVNVV